MTDLTEEYEDDFEEPEDDETRSFSDGSLGRSRFDRSATFTEPALVLERLREELSREPEEVSAEDIQALLDRCDLPRDALDAPVYKEGELSLLELAVQRRHTPAVQLFLRLGLAEADRVVGLGCTCLAHCCEQKDAPVALCRALLAAGASPNARIGDAPGAMTCLHAAIGHGDLRLVQLLLEYHADLSLTWEGMNPMTMAVDLQQCEIANAIQAAEQHGALDDMADWVLRYEDLQIGESLGSGGFGQVFRGTLRGSAVAVKRCLCQDSSMLAAFQKEARMLSSFHHEQVVLFVGACFELPNLCIVTELMAGGNLYSMLHSSATIAWPLRLQWARDVARGMRYLHTLQPPVVHRDLKSPNILLSEQFTVKLCDFGMSSTKQHTAIHTKQAGGSPLWMAPECLMGESITEKADVYSFGVVLWELLTREVPWEDKALVQLVGLVGYSKNTLPVPAPLPAECPPDYAAAMRSCWRPVPADRPDFCALVPALEALAAP